MASKKQDRSAHRATPSQQPPAWSAGHHALGDEQHQPALLLESAVSRPKALAPCAIGQLQRTIGNHATAQRLTKPDLQHSQQRSVLQRTYDELNWGEEQIIANVQGTSIGVKLYQDALEAAALLGLKLKILVSDGHPTGMTIINKEAKLLICVIPGQTCEGDATQILVQELGNAANKAQLDAVGSEEAAKQSSKETYVTNIESLEYSGAQASHMVFEEAKKMKAEWTKGGKARWTQEEIKNLQAYLDYLKATKASRVYEDRWEQHNTYLLYMKDDYRLFGINLQERDEATIILVHKNVKVLEGTATGSFAKIVENPKLLFNAYVWKHQGGT